MSLGPDEVVTAIDASLQPLPEAGARRLLTAIDRVQSVVVAQVNRELVRRHHLSLTELDVLEAAAEPATMTQLRARCGLGASGVTRVVTALVDRGLLQCDRRAGDRRLKHAWVTDEGQRLATAADATLTSALQSWSAADRDLTTAARTLEALMPPARSRSPGRIQQKTDTSPEK